MKQPFINEAFTKAINDYVESKNKEEGVIYNSFLVVFVRLLVIIYNESDIINPFKIMSVESLRNNLQKFGISENEINTLFINLQLYYDIEKENLGSVIKKDNPYFILIQKKLIDMFIAKKLSYEITEDEKKKFYNILYTPDTPNPLLFSYNYLTAKDVNEIKNYFIKQMNENEKIRINSPKSYLNAKAYEILGYDFETVDKLNNEDLEKLNHQVYDFFKIRENAINKEYLLEKALENWLKEKNKLTSGNGYVDILLVISIISTILMVIAVVVVSV
ncbi:MAG: hypothetical protein E7172_02755 [Firmicutes bacterium]|nr:hypothetical protein [Bacillota bacterium]